MQRIQPDLWQTEVENPAPGLYTHAYLLIRDNGNVLFYNTGNREEIARLGELGGVAYQYLSHLDELGDSLVGIGDRYGAKLGGHVRELEEFSRYRLPDIQFDRREVHHGNIEVIPTPGHSPGSTSFLVDAPGGKRYLFTGDTLFFTAAGTLEAGFLKGRSDLDAYVKSLETLRALQPDVVISSASGGHDGFLEITPHDWPGHVDRALDNLLNGRSNLG